MKKRKNQFPEIIVDGLKHQSVGSISRLLIAFAMGEILFRLFEIARSIGFTSSFLSIVAIRMTYYAHQIKRWGVPLRETLFYRYLWFRLSIIFLAALLMIVALSNIAASNPIVTLAYLLGMFLFLILARLFQKRLFDENIVLLLRHYSNNSLRRAKRLAETVSNVATIHVVAEPEYNFMDTVEKLHNPVGVKFIATQNEWQETVLNKCRQAIAIVIDVEREDPSPNLLWEIEQTGKLFAEKTVLVAPPNISLDWKANIAPATQLILYEVDHQSDKMKRDLLGFILKSKKNYSRNAVQL